MNKTTNYQLNQWERTDKVQMEDFNADNAKIDAALAEEVSRLEQSISSAATKAAEEHVYMGSFVGDGKDGRVLQLPWAPKFVILFGNKNTSSGIGYMGFLTTEHFHFIERIVYPLAENDNSPKLSGGRMTLPTYTWFNESDKTTQYILFR